MGGGRKTGENKMKTYIIAFLLGASALCARHEPEYQAAIRENPKSMVMSGGAFGAASYDQALDARVFYGKDGNAICYVKYISDGEFRMYSMDGIYLMKIIIDENDTKINYFDTKNNLISYGIWNESKSCFDFYRADGNFIFSV
jgi:hypothetical protein